MKQIAYLILGLVLVVSLLAMARRRSNLLHQGLPPQELVGSQLEASILASTRGEVVIGVLGTGSMAPYIPASARGEDPLTTTVAYAVLDQTRGYKDLHPGDLVVYHADWNPENPVIHLAEVFDQGGWIMTGLHNKSSETHWRITENRFVGVAAKTYVWPVKP